MNKSTVYFSDLRASPRRNLLDKVADLLDHAGVADRIHRGDLVAVKLHFGERGNTSFIRPVFVRRVVERLRDLGARPFLTDTNTLYTGSRSEAATHLQTAIQNGFAYAVVDAPVVIADGLRGNSSVTVPITGGSHFQKVSIAAEIANADSLVVLNESRIEPSVADDPPGTRYQFERQGYFIADDDSKPGALVFNRTVTLRDTWAKIVGRGAGAGGQR